MTVYNMDVKRMIGILFYVINDYDDFSFALMLYILITVANNVS